jgi:oligopeptide/dipeptide ABC transporter ATP-binding protein
MPSSETGVNAMNEPSNNPPVIEGRNLTKVFAVPGGGLFGRHSIAAVDRMSLALYDRPTIVSLVGESGSGKTTFSRLLLGLTPPTSGEIFYRGKDISDLSREEWQDFRRNVQPVFQDPFSIYNPFYRIERVLELMIKNFGLASSSDEAKQLMDEALRAVDLRPQDVVGRYPHQLSGGQAQRVMLARIFLVRPKIIIADEPVSMIDVAVRTLFLNILADFRDKYDVSCLFITHNLANAYYLGGQMMVLCFGRVVEQGNLDEIVDRPAHPYTQELLRSIPSPDPTERWADRVSLQQVERPLTHDAHKCVYVARCPHAMDICSQERPPEYVLGEEHYASCYLYRDAPVHELSVASRVHT